MLLIDIYSETRARATVYITTMYNENHLKYLILRSIDPLNGYCTHSKMIVRVNLRDRNTPVTDCSSYELHVNDIVTFLLIAFLTFIRGT